MPDVEAHERARRVFPHLERLVGGIDRVNDDGEGVQLHACAGERDDALQCERWGTELLGEADLAAESDDLEVRTDLGEVCEVGVVKYCRLWELNFEPVEVREGAKVCQREMLKLVEMEVQVMPETKEMEIDATPILVEEGVEAVPEVVEQSVDAVSPVEDKATDTLELELTTSAPSENPTPTHMPANMPPLFTSFVPSINGLVSLPFRAVRVYTYYLSLPLRYMFSFNTPLMPALSDYASNMQEAPKSPASGENAMPEKPMNHMDGSTPHENGTNGAAMPGPTTDASVTTVGH